MLLSPKGIRRFMNMLNGKVIIYKSLQYSNQQGSIPLSLFKIQGCEFGGGFVQIFGIDRMLL